MVKGEVMGEGKKKTLCRAKTLNKAGLAVPSMTREGLVRGKKFIL